MSDTLAMLRTEVRAGTFDPRLNPGSSVIGMIIDASGKVVHHRSISVPDTQFGLLALYPRLFPDTSIALNAPYGVMMLGQQGPRLGRTVQIVGVFLKQPGYTLNRR